MSHGDTGSPAAPKSMFNPDPGPLLPDEEEGLHFTAACGQGPLRISVTTDTFSPSALLPAPPPPGKQDSWMMTDHRPLHPVDHAGTPLGRAWTRDGQLSAASTASTSARLFPRASSTSRPARASKSASTPRRHSSARFISWMSSSGTALDQFGCMTSASEYLSLRRTRAEIRAAFGAAPYGR